MIRPKEFSLTHVFAWQEVEEEEKERE